MWRFVTDRQSAQRRPSPGDPRGPFMEANTPQATGVADRAEQSCAASMPSGSGDVLLIFCRKGTRRAKPVGRHGLIRFGRMLGTRPARCDLGGAEGGLG